MNKDRLICFRATKALYDALSVVAKDERRSLSSTIEIVLMKYLSERKVLMAVTEEKRQFARKAFSVPAVVNRRDTGQMGIGTIREISLGGVGITLSQEFGQKIRIDLSSAQFEIVFNIPIDNKSITLACEAKRIVDSKDGVHIGAAFVDADFQSYKDLQNYLM